MRERVHGMLHSVLLSQAKCPECDYRAPMDGADRIVVAVDRLTAAVDRLIDAIAAPAVSEEER